MGNVISNVRSSSSMQTNFTAALASPALLYGLAAVVSTLEGTSC